MSQIDKLAMLAEVCQSSCPQARCNRTGFYRPRSIGDCGPSCGTDICPPEAPDGCTAACLPPPGGHL